jgi:hypothetical protein
VVGDSSLTLRHELLIIPNVTSCGLVDKLQLLRITRRLQLHLQGRIMTALSYREYANSRFLELLVSINRTTRSHIIENGDAKMHRRHGLETSNK